MNDARDPNHSVIYMPTRPDFSIRVLRGTSTSRGYHETYYEVVNRYHDLDDEDFKRLDQCGLIGMGQAYYVSVSGRDHTEFEEDAVATVVDRRTEEPVPGAVALNWDGTPNTTVVKYKYHRYEVKRICDSGD